MTLPDIQATCATLAQQLKQHIQDNQISNPMVVGVHTGGVWVAQHLIDQFDLPGPLYTVDISFYRDDFNHKGLNPKVCGSSLPDTIEGRDLILIDDVIMSGRSVRAAINELFDYGRPNSITFACLLDVGQRQLPFQPDACGAQLSLDTNQRIKVQGPSPLSLTLKNNTES